MSNEAEFLKNDFRRKGSLIYKESDLKIVDDIINEAKIICKAYKRAIFIKKVVSTGSIKDSALFVGVHPNTGSEWLKRFNEEGIDGLFPKYAGGRPSFLSDDELDELKNLLKAENENYSIKDAKKLIYDEFSVDYSYKQVWEIVTKKLGLSYRKPFPKYSDRPENAEEQLLKNNEFKFG